MSSEPEQPRWFSLLSSGRIVALTAIVAAAFALRLPYISSLPVTADEAMHLHPMTWADAFFFDLPQNPPFYRLLTQLACLWQRSITTARLVSATAGALTTIPLYLAVRQRTGPGVALAAAALLALHPWHIRYSQTARAFALLTLFSTAGFAASLMANRSGRLTHRAVQVLFHGLALFTHYLAVFPIFLEGLTALGPKGRRTAPLLLAVPLFSVLVLGPYLAQGLQGKAALGAAAGFVNGLPFAFGLLQATFCLPGLALVALCTATLAAAWSRQARIFLIQAAGLALLTTLAGVFIPIEVRYAITALPFFLAATAVGAARMWSAARQQLPSRLTVTAALLLGLCGLVFPLPLYYCGLLSEQTHRELSRNSDGADTLLELAASAGPQVEVVLALGGPQHFRGLCILNHGRYPDNAVLADRARFSVVTAPGQTVVAVETPDAPLSGALNSAVCTSGCMLIAPLDDPPMDARGCTLLARKHRLGLWRCPEPPEATRDRGAQ